MHDKPITIRHPRNGHAYKVKAGATVDGTEGFVFSHHLGSDKQDSKRFDSLEAARLARDAFVRDKVRTGFRVIVDLYPDPVLVSPGLFEPGPLSQSDLAPRLAMANQTASPIPPASRARLVVSL
jgi:hypothetical protein